MRKINIKTRNFKIIAIIFYNLFFFISCMQEKTAHSNKFILHGKILNQKDGFLILKYTPDSIIVKDTVFIKNGEFTYKGFISEPTLANIINENDKGTFYLEQKNMAITLVKDKFNELKLKGSKTQTESEKLDKIKNNSRLKIKILYKKKDSLKKLNTKIEKKELKKKLKEINKKITQESSILESNIIQFTLSNPKSFIVPFHLMLLQERNSISLDSVKSIFKTLDISVQNSKDGKKLRSNILKEERLQIGAIPPNFSVLDINKKPISLKQFRGKNIVLLDFWASWCTSCRKSFPHLKKLYKKYHPDGFEILAISVFDSNIESWKKAINQEEINDWYNIVSNFMNGEIINKVFLDKYNPTPIPKKMLIDKTGRIVGLWVGYSEEIENDIDKKLRKIFATQETVNFKKENDIDKKLN